MIVLGEGDSRLIEILYFFLYLQLFLLHNFSLESIGLNLYRFDVFDVLFIIFLFFPFLLG